MNLLKEIPPGTAEEVNVIIEIPKGARNKYEYDKKKNIFTLDRVNHTLFHYPTDYGFVPGTHCEDGDPLDAYVMMREGTYPGILIKARPIAVMDMNDSGEEDNKLICVPVDDPYFAGFQDLKDIPEHFLKELQHFMEHYKDLQKKKVVVAGFRDVAAAKQEVTKAIKLYRENAK